jgi:signal transduction histidine kinase
MHNGTQIGSLALGLSTERINKEVRNARFLSLFIAIAIIFFGIIINRALSYGITIPITQIVKSIDKLGTDDWKDIKVTSEDEIGQMAKAFNRFAEEFKKEQELLVRKEELEKAQEELKRAMEIKSEFTSMVSHELRTPLTAIKESIGIVLDETAGELNDEQKDFLSTAKRNVDRLHRLINDVLDFSKLESGKIKYDMKPYNINEVIKEAMKTHMSVAEQKNLYLVSNLDPDIPIMVFDDDRITQVITNFLSNALKFTEKGGITVTSDYNKEEKMVYVCVKDTGPGIKKEDIPKLFKQFSQLGGPDGRQTGGAGLGLAICKKIIEDHRGKTWVESEVGKGSSFYFKLPVS